MPPTLQASGPVRTAAVRRARANDAIRAFLAARRGRALRPEESALYRRLLTVWCEAVRSEAGQPV